MEARKWEVNAGGRGWLTHVGYPAPMYVAKVKHSQTNNWDTTARAVYV